MIYNIERLGTKKVHLSLLFEGMIKMVLKKKKKQMSTSLYYSRLYSVSSSRSLAYIIVDYTLFQAPGQDQKDNGKKITLTL